MPIYRSVKKLCILLLMVTAAALNADSELQGVASWYGGKFHGRLTSSGEVFDTNDLTAAHKSLPFGTIVKVTNLDNGRSVVVRINDRGPFVEGRIIDLSRAAAEALGMLGLGVAHVSLEIVSFATDKELYAIQVGAYGLEKNADRARESLETAGFVVTIEKTGMGIVRVLVRGIANKDLPDTRRRLETLGFSQYLVKREKTEAPQISQNTASPAESGVTIP
ncbi:MAG: septal ring lytic transglycosylase RlpA family protein [Spirochaetia bacterium]|jgi:rare lipoprotein A